MTLKALSLWNSHEGTERFIRVSSNFVFSFKSGEDSFILRLTPGEDRLRLQAEMDFLLLLSNQGLTVNMPVPSVNGNLIEPIVTDAGNFQAVVFNFFEGEQLEIDEMTGERMEAWGRALGSLHAVSNGISWLTDHTRLESLLGGNGDNLPMAVRREESYLRNWLYGLQQTQESYGPIHFDLELDNIIWQGSKPQIIDFESSLTGWYAADIAFALRDLFEDVVDLQDEKFSLFLQGYRQARPIGDQEVKDIPMFLRYRQLLTYKLLLNSMDVKVNPEQPEWVNELIIKLENKRAQYEAGFEVENEMEQRSQ
ncbi:hypothetical protein D3H55_08050 [Bacillus salacetis]|uniref:Aminoglycoside phosphotransferase domain-containing protein n=1 Tax=Bacillus salacetis TaxID=2315464 RepID=A0A3A1R1B7_9BACI|nr:phosphotransferase [Bacillus salacetis]RIW35338.1 hypothetical protein D3H55_08050 [Bacillus salacetis]